jgi:transcriptional regulator with GAF, ATPase, and Fis domain
MGLCLSRAPAPGEEAAGILRSIADLIVALRGRAVAASGAPGEDRRMAGEGAAITGVRTKVGKAAAYDSTILITGESGTGKELVACEIHQLSPRQRGPLVALNCAAMPEALLESELFGHEKGAFTGAMEAKPGKFEEADGGTLFLDEIGDMPLSAQAKLLRVLEDSCVTRVGGKGWRRVNVRVIAATNRDLRAMVACGKFREDLMHRISVVKILLPPLRDRREDIPTIVAEILRRLERKQNRKLSITPRAVELLARLLWPGNIRELANVLEEATVLCGPDLDETHFAGIQTSPAVEAPCVPIAEAAEPPGPRLVSRAAAPTSPAAFEPGTARDLVWQRTCEVLRQTSFRICAAAKLIGWTRQWMRKFVIKHKLDELLGFVRIRRKPAAAT